MLHVPLPSFETVQTNDSLLVGTTVTSGASAHTYGDWTQVHSGLDRAAFYVTVMITSGPYTSATIKNGYLDIGIGPNTGAVETLVPYLCQSHIAPATTPVGPSTYFLPLYIPAGTPIWARTQATASLTPSTIVFSFSCGTSVPGNIPRVYRYEVIGTPVTASTTGVPLTPVNGSEGAWAELTASTSRNYAGIVMSGVFITDSAMSPSSIAVDVGIGGAGSESVLFDNAIVQFSSNAEASARSVFPLLSSIPAGQRLSVRGATNGTISTGYSALALGLVT